MKSTTRSLLDVVEWDENILCLSFHWHLYGIYMRNCKEEKKKKQGNQIFLQKS